MKTINKDDAIEKAYTIYMESACIETDFKPISMVELSEKITAMGFKCSKSSIGRWSKKGNWIEDVNKKSKDFYSFNEDADIENIDLASCSKEECNKVETMAIKVLLKHFLYPHHYAVSDLSREELIEKNNTLYSSLNRFAILLSQLSPYNSIHEAERDLKKSSFDISISEMNKEMEHKLSSLLLSRVTKLLEKDKRGMPLSALEDKMVLNGFKIISSKEDQLLRRLSIGMELITSEDAIKALKNTKIDIEGLSDE